MKLRLPLSLRFALLAVCAVASLTSFSQEVVFENYETGATDAFKQEYGEGPSYTIEDTLRFLNNHNNDGDGDVLFIPGDLTQHLPGDLTFRNATEFEMTGNFPYTTPNFHHTAQNGHALLDVDHNLTFQNCGKVKVAENYSMGKYEDGVFGNATLRVIHGDLTFRNCGEIEITGNGSKAVGSHWEKIGEEWQEVEGDLYDPDDYDELDMPLSSLGSAIDVPSGRLVFEGNDKVVLRGNYAAKYAGWWDNMRETLDQGQPGPAEGELFGPLEWRYLLSAIYVGMPSYSEGVNDGSEIKVRDGQTFECYDAVYINGSLYINGDKDYLGTAKDDKDRYRGTVTFSGRYTREDLKKLMGREPTEMEIIASTGVGAYYVQVCDGTLALENSTLNADRDIYLYRTWSIDMESRPGEDVPPPPQYSVRIAESAKLVMKDSSIWTSRPIEEQGYLDKAKELDAHALSEWFVQLSEQLDSNGHTQYGVPVLTNGEVFISSASFSGANTIYAHLLESTGGTWTFNVSEKNLTHPILTLKFHDYYEKKAENGTWVSGTGTFTSRAGTVFDIQFEGTLAAGKYKLLEFDKTDGSWEHEAGIPRITGKASSTAIGETGQGDVYLMTDGDMVTLIFDVAGGSVEPEPKPEPSPEPSPEPAPEDRQPTTLTWGNGNGTWADGKGNGDGHWAGDVTDRNFYKGDSVVFSSAAEVTLQGVIRPGNVLVNNADGTVKFTGSGQITDVDIPSQRVKLIKEGAGTLVIDTNNAYTGGTELKAGTLVAGSAGALGLGAVNVTGGTLNMGGQALGNNVVVSSAATITGGSAYRGTLTVQGGTLSGEALNLSKTAELKGGSVSNKLAGIAGVNVSGDVTLSGANTYAGKTMVQGGGNLHVTGSLESKDLEVQSGGTYSGTIGGAGLSVNLAGGVVVGDVTLGEDTVLRATAQGAAVKGKLSMTTGSTLSVKDVQEGATLSVSELVASGGTLGLDPAKPGALGVETFTTTGRKTALNVDDVLNWKAGEYTLFTYKSLGSGSSVDSLYLAALEGLHSRKQFDLRLEQTSLTLSVKGVSADLTWQGSTGTWNNSGTGGEWNTSVDDKQFFDGDRVTFDASAQNVEAKVEGTVTPGEVHVQGDKDVTLNGEGNIAGSAPLTKQGKGTLDMQTDNGSYTGDITVTEGTLRAGNANALGTGNVFVDGATFDANNMNVAANVTMRGQSTLENAGNVKTLTFDSGSSVKSTSGYTLSSGNTLTIGPTGSAYTGDFTFAGGTLALTGGAFDLSGANVTFSGEQHSVLDLSGWAGLTAGQEYTVFTGNLPTDMLDVRLGDGGTAHLETRGGEIVLVVDQPGVPSTAVAQGGAEYATAISSQTEGNMAHLRRLRGAIGSGQALSSDRKVGAYITGYTEDNRLEQDAQGLGYHRTEIGGMLGVETALRDGQFVGGAALSAGRAHISPTGPAPRYHEDVIREDLYLIANFGRLRSTTTVGLGQHEIDMRRAPSNGMAAPSQDVTGNSVNLSEELAVTFIRSEKHSFESFFAVESSYNHLDGFSESGNNPASLAVDAHEAFATDLSLGLRANFLFPIVPGAPSAVFSIQGAAITSVGDTVTDVTMRYAGTPELPYDLRSAKRNRWGYSAGASLTVPVSPSAAIFGSSEAILRGDSHEVTATLGVKLTF